jgi:cardiolipin synthase (CMP-forming)
VGRYRARDLVNAPTLLSLARVPLAAAFPFFVGRPWVCLAILGAAALTDVLDGFIARRFGLSTPTGAVVDGITDKLFVGTVLVALLVSQHLSPRDVALLGTRELGELPLVLWVALSPAARGRKVDDRANAVGKAATTLQFATIVATLVRSELFAAALYATAITGAAAALTYWMRALRAKREA